MERHVLPRREVYEINVIHQCSIKIGLVPRTPDIGNLMQWRRSKLIAGGLFSCTHFIRNFQVYPRSYIKK